LQGGSIANPEIRIQIAKRTDGVALRLKYWRVSPGKGIAGTTANADGVTL
jgi:hypothetical protein